MRGKKSSKSSSSSSSSSSSLALVLNAVAEATTTPNKTSAEKNVIWGLVVFLVLFVGSSSSFVNSFVGNTHNRNHNRNHNHNQNHNHNHNQHHHRIGTRSLPFIIVPSVIERTSIIMSSSLSSTNFDVKNDEDDVNDDNNDAAAPVILLIGSCGLDRLLTVSNYPAADAKVRTTSYNERGGGNSANTASAIGKIAEAKLFCSRSLSQQQHQKQKGIIRIKFLTKVGGDTVGQQLIDELNSSNVETTSDLFRRGEPSSTTSFTTIIVSEKEQTRTCIHTPGTCGELSLDDVKSLSIDDIDRIFRHAVHLHSDSRHTDVSLWMTKEAKKRGITVSCDCEKDRRTEALDELIDVCDILFTNSNHLGEYIERLTNEKEAAAGRHPLPKPTIIIDDKKTTTTKSFLDQSIIDTYVKSLTPSAYFARWQPDRLGKEVIVTHGSMGSLHYKAVEVSTRKSLSSSSSSSSSIDLSRPQNIIQIELDDDRDNNRSSIIRLRHSFNDNKEGFDVLYEICQAGVLKDAKIVDTTGAGDAFIGGYLISRIALEENKDEDEKDKNIVQFALEMGSFVGGKKLAGPGARTALPTSKDIDLLGSDLDTVKQSLGESLGPFAE